MKNNNKGYLIVSRIHGKLFLHGDDMSEVNLFDTKENAIGFFAPLLSSLGSKNIKLKYESIGKLAMLKPHIIEVDTENMEEVERHIIEKKMCKLDGEYTGLFVCVCGVSVKDKILKLSVCDIAKEYLNKEV